MAVGFCDDNATINCMLGWVPGSWGFHSDDGRVYGDGRMQWKGLKYDVPYVNKSEKAETVDVTIGCGVNFAESTAFYTKNGVVIGKSVASYLPGVALKAERERKSGR